MGRRLYALIVRRKGSPVEASKIPRKDALDRLVKEPGWRNRLTRCSQKALSFGACGFESRSGHNKPPVRHYYLAVR